MNIRQAEKEDLPQILKLNQKALPHVSSVELSDMEDFLKDADPFLVVENEDILVGFMIILQKGLDYSSLNYRFFCNHYSDFDYVDRIVISEDHRGHNFGTSLYEYLFDASDKEIVTCEVNIKPPNEISMDFHKSLGFKRVAELKTGGGKKSVAMLVKEL